jgi:WD40 repeat protein
MRWVPAGLQDFGGVKLFRWPAPTKKAGHLRYGGHSSHVTNVRFSPDALYLASTGGFDRAVMVWRHVF